MMKKVIKKLLAALLAVAMVCAMAIPAFAYNPGETEEDLNKNHGYIAFQIFTGVISKDNPKLSDVTWGSHITDPAAFLEQLKNDSTIGAQFRSIDATDATDAATVQKVLAVIGNGTIPMLTASLSRVLYATISTRMETRNPPL